MGKTINCAIIGIIFAALGFCFARYCPLVSSLSARDVVAISTVENLRALTDKKIVRLTSILEKMTDADSARKHLPAAQATWLEISLITARGAMLSRDKIPATWASTKEQPWTNLRAQLDRISKSPEIGGELTPSLDYVFALGSIRLDRAANSANKANSLRSTIYTLRSQLELYKLQHNDNYPDLKTFGWSQLTQPTTANGQIADGPLTRNHQNFGPYIQQFPLNPFTDSSKVTVIKNTNTDFKPNKALGFVFEESSGHIYGVNADGSLFNPDQAADVR